MLEAYLRYCAGQIEKGCRPGLLYRHLFGLYQGQPGAKRWRRYISQHAHLEPQNDRLLLQALAAMSEGSSIQHAFSAMD